MEINWHETKRQSNLTKHGLDFSQAHKVFAGATFTFEDNRFDYGEQRFVTIGLWMMWWLLFTQNQEHRFV